MLEGICTPIWVNHAIRKANSCSGCEVQQPLVTSLTWREPIVVSQSDDHIQLGCITAIALHPWWHKRV